MKFILSLAALLMVFNTGYAQEAQSREEALRAIQEAVTQARENIELDIENPPLPSSIQSLVNSGAQVQFLGQYNNFNGWIVLNNGAPSYVYVSPDGQTIFRGFMFDENGTAVTVQQVAEAQLRNPAFFGLDEDQINQQVQEDMARGAGQTLYDALSVSNYFIMGSTDNNAPILYAFMDPDCPHCKRMIENMYPQYLANDQIQLRVIPIGVLSEASERRSATLLASDNAEELLRDHSFGTADIPVDPNIDLTRQNLNIELFTLWQFDGTPILVFEDKQDVVQMVRGTPRDLNGMIDLIKNGS